MSAFLFSGLSGFRAFNSAVQNKICVITVCIAFLFLRRRAFNDPFRFNASRDEQMAVFDAQIFASGHLVAQLGQLWRDHADALNTIYMYPAEHRTAWVSAYLPMNAAIRAVVGLLSGHPEWTGPLWTALGVIVLCGCVRRLWPQDQHVGWLAILLYTLSGQIVLTGMTAYAMPAHLTLNLLWLWLFLAKRNSFDLLAVLVGFIAVGLHQPLMHPLFAAPILLLLPLNRDWKRTAFYLFAYIFIGLFWLYWPNYMWQMVQSNQAATPPSSIDYYSRLVTSITENNWLAISFMFYNLVRYIAWNHPLLLPLMFAGVIALKKNKNGYTLPVALLAGIMLTFVAMIIIIPYQGLGFGYRYFHGLTGSFILLAIFGWRAQSAQNPKWRHLLIYASVLTALIFIPLQLWFAHDYNKAFANVSSQIKKIDADYVVINTKGAAFLWDLVLNNPQLDNRPILLDSDKINEQLIKELCAPNTSVAIVPNWFETPIYDYFSVFLLDDSSWQQSTSMLFKNAGCRIAPLLSP